MVRHRCLPYDACVTDTDSGRKILTLEDLYHPSQKVDFEGKAKKKWVWMDESRYLCHPTEKDPIDAGWCVASIHSETAEPLYDVERLKAVVRECAGVGLNADGKPSRPALNADATAGLVTFDSALYRYIFDTESAVELAKSIDEDVGAEFSPDSRWATYVSDNNLSILDLETRTARSLTDDGSGDVLNGRLDWVYQEELYGRGKFKGFWWSPDSKRISFLRLDVSDVGSHTIAADDATDAGPVRYRYPRAGTPNPVARLGIIEVSSGKIRWIDFPGTNDVEHLIVNVAWSPGGDTLSCQVQNREQTWLELHFVDPATAEARLILRETSTAWVRVAGPPSWCDDGSIVWISDRSGWSHLYHYDRDGILKLPLTSGAWDVRGIYGIESGSGDPAWVYFAATEHSPISVHTYRIRFDGGDLERLTTEEGTHQSTFAPDMAHFIDTWSSPSSPAEVRLHTCHGMDLRQLEACTAPSVSDYALGTTEHFQVETRDGFTLEAIMIKPPDFDPNRKYPVLCHVYGGPSTSLVCNAWGGPTRLWHHMLAQRGSIIWVVDNRTASGKGMVSAWPVYRNFGPLELQDLEDSVGWLCGQRYVDRERIGIWGWSFGGYLTVYAMTHSELFRAGIAGASVTDWTMYDTIYTERFMQTPEHNPDGYRNSSVLEAASNLHGKLLIVHGTMDDNVHIEHSMCLIRELQRAGKEFDVMVVPGAGHRIEDDAQLYDLRRRMTRFITENL